MAIGAGAAGAWAATNATTHTVTLPAHAAGNLLVVIAACKAATIASVNQSITTPATGWTRVAAFADGTTASGNGTGSVNQAIFYKVATSGAETNPVVTWGGSQTGAPGIAVGLCFTKGGSESWLDPVAVQAATNAATSISVTMGSNPGITAGDWGLAVHTTADDAVLTVPSWTATSTTLAAVVEYPATAIASGTSNDMAGDVGYRSVTSGTATAAPVVTGTQATAETGVTGFIRLRVVAEPAATTVYPTDTTVVLGGASASLLSDFTGSDEDPLSEGGNWAALTTAVAGVRRVSNAVAAATVRASYWTPANFGPDVELHATLPTIGAARLVARIQGEGGSNTWDGYSVYYLHGTTQLLIYRNTNGGDAVLTTTTIAALTNGAKIGMACHGSTIEAWYQPSGGSWTKAGSAIDTTYPSAGKVGLILPNSATRLDDFYAGTATETFPATEREAWTSRGAGVQTDVTNTATGPTALIQVTDTAGGTVVDWFTRPLTAFTLGGAVRVNVRALESNVAANTAIACEVARVETDGSAATVWGSTTQTAELGTSEAAESFLVVGNDLAISDGQRLRIRFAIDDAPGVSMAASQTVTLYYAGTSGGASGDTYLTFTQTLTEFSAGTSANAITATATAAAIGSTDAIVATLAVATTTGQAYNPTAQSGIATTAQVATATGTALDTDAKVAPTAQVAAGTGAAHNATVSTAVSVTASVATATGTASNASVTQAKSVTAEVASATGAAADADLFPSQVFTASVATGTGTAYDATATGAGAATSANAITATATGAAAAAAPSIAPDVDLATASGMAITATAHETQPANLQAAAGTGEALGTDAKVGATSVVAAATGAALPVTSKLTVNAGVAAGTGAALVADGLPGTRALANVATATGAALVADGLPGELAPAEVAAAAGTAQNSTTKIAPTLQAAAATGTANNTTVSVASTGQVTGQTAEATGAALGTDAVIAPRTVIAAATGAAANPSVHTAISRTAGVAAGTGAAGDIDAKLAVNAGSAAATGTAANATVTTTAAASATAQVATAQGAAHAATVGAASTISATAAAATATGTAYNASVVVAAVAQAATGTGNVHAAAIAVAVAAHAQTATATGTAYAAGVALGAVAALAEVAAASGTAYNARAQTAIGSGIDTAGGIHGGIVSLPAIRAGVASVPGVRGGIAAEPGIQGGIVTEPRLRGRVA